MRWIGRQTVAPFFAGALRLPIRVKAGAFGDDVPCRDLLLSPDHALFVDGVLAIAGALVNGTSIVHESNVPVVFTYYHVEVDDHSLILAENTPAETFIDNADRETFDNWREFEELYPEGKSIVEMPYPRAKAYRQVPRTIRERLAERGVALYGAPDRLRCLIARFSLYLAPCGGAFERRRFLEKIRLPRKPTRGLVPKEHIFIVRARAPALLGG